MKIKLSPEQLNFFNSFGSVVDANDGGKWYFVPYWFHVTDDIAEIYKFDTLPEYLKKVVRELRGEESPEAKNTELNDALKKLLTLDVFDEAAHDGEEHYDTWKSTELKEILAIIKKYVQP